LSEFLERVRALIRAGDVQISEHGYDELAEDGLSKRGAQWLSGRGGCRGIPELSKGTMRPTLEEGPNGRTHSCYMGYSRRS
jgi:hypothetical protein